MPQAVYTISKKIDQVQQWYHALEFGDSVQGMKKEKEMVYEVAQDRIPAP